MTKLNEVKQFIQQNNIQAEIIERPGRSGITSESAAEVTGVKIQQIIKTLLFIGKKKNLAIVICQGNKRIDTKKLSEISGVKKPRMARPEELAEILGTVPGGTPPICLPENIPVFVDKGVMQQEFVVGSAGSEFVGIKLSPSDIVKFTKAKIVDVGE